MKEEAHLLSRYVYILRFLELNWAYGEDIISFFTKQNASCETLTYLCASVEVYRYMYRI